MHDDLAAIFDLAGRTAIITGAAGLLGRRHAETIKMLGGIPILVDLVDCSGLASELTQEVGAGALYLRADITSVQDVEAVRDRVVEEYGRIDILINNAANNPSVEGGSQAFSRLEEFSLDQWRQDIEVGLTGALICARTFGEKMVQARSGVILNMSSDLGLIAPDQRIYNEPDTPSKERVVKPVSYSVVKSGIIGLTRYLATYWSSAGVRVNALAPGGVENDQDDAFVERLTNLIPLGRMAAANEYQAAIAFMVSDASSYMTGAVVSIDGGRTAW